jgi:hypothetical protein
VTGNHFVLDLVAGVAVMALAVVLVHAPRWIGSRVREHRARTAPRAAEAALTARRS